MLECEAAFENMQSRKSQLQEELTGLKKQFTRIASGGDFEHTKSQLQGEVRRTFSSVVIINLWKQCINLLIWLQKRPQTTLMFILKVFKTVLCSYLFWFIFPGVASSQAHLSSWSGVRSKSTGEAWLATRACARHQESVHHARRVRDAPTEERETSNGARDDAETVLRSSRAERTLEIWAFWDPR